MAQKTISFQKIRRLYQLTSELEDLLEEILESEKFYKKKFLKGLYRSLKEAKQGKLKEIKSLREL